MLNSKKISIIGLIAIHLMAPPIAMGGPVESFNFNSLPLFQGLAKSDPKYKEATSKFQEAFFLQTGITPAVGSTVKSVEKLVTEKTSKAIDDNTPFRSKDVFFVGGATYTLLVKKQVVQKFKNPLLPGVTNVVTGGKNSGSILFSVPF